MIKKMMLLDICDIYNGGTPNSKEKSFWGEGFQWLTPKDMGRMKTNYVSISERQITKSGLENSSAKLIPENSVILSCRAPIGHVAINEVPMCFNQGCKGLVPKNGLLTKFLYYFLISSKKLLNKLGSGTTFKEISARTLGKVEISIPPISVQQQIIDKLDAAFFEIDYAVKSEEELLFKITKLRQEILDSWIANKTNSKDLYKVQDCIENNWIHPPFDGNHGEFHPKARDYKNNGIPFIMAKDLSAGEVDLVNCKFISREQALSLRVGFAKDNDILLSHKGTIGEVALLKYEKEFLMLTPQITAYRVIDKERVDTNFLYYFFKSNIFQTQLKTIAGIGSTRAYIGITRQRQLNICLPSIELQKKAVQLMTIIEPMLIRLYEINIQNWSFFRS